MIDKYNIDGASSNSILKNQGNNPLDALMRDMMQDVADQLKERLKVRDINTTSLSLSQSIRPKAPRNEDGGVTIEIEANTYWKFINYGVNGSEKSHGAPNWGTQPKTGVSFHQEILNWIPKRGVIAKPDENGNIPSYEELAWAIQGKIRRDGKEPKPFYNDVINQKLVSYMKPQIEALIGRAIQVNITFPWQ